jgi:hypothetical protein
LSDSKVIERALPLLEADPAAILEQLERLLADPLFKNSRRYPRLLQYVVTHRLDSSGPELKERTLGVDVFGRAPDYDTAVDPVVRMTASEVRKRLAHYYDTPEHADEIRICLPAGSYVPEFHLPGGKGTDPAPDTHGISLEVLPEMASSARNRSTARLPSRLLYGAACAALAVGFLTWWGIAAPNRALDTFWNPVLGKSDSVMLSVGQRDEAVITAAGEAAPSAQQITLARLYYLESENVAMPDVIALARLGGLMQSRHFRYHIRSATQTNLADFRENPVILVGAFTNDWTLRLNSPLRFSFVREKNIFMIRDRQNPSQLKWFIDYDTPYLKLAIDYALITRVVDPASQRLVVSVAGLGGYGTQAASEFLTEPAHMQKLKAIAPRDWERRNLQVVISARVINGSSGPPEIIAAYFW